MNEREKKYYAQGFAHGSEQRAAGSPAIHLRKPLADALHVSEDEAARLTVENYQRRLDAVPSLAKYPELRGIRECVMAYDQGVADGTGVPLTDIILRANFLHMITDGLRVSTPSSRRPAESPGCTLVYFPESDRGPLIANNQDGVRAHVHRTPPPWIVANKAGLILGCVSSGLYDDEVSPEPFPVPVYLMIYETCTKTDETVDLLTRLNLFWGPNNTLVADRHGNSAVVEKSTCRNGVRKSTDGFSATTEMSAEDPAYKKYLWQTRERSLAPRGLDRTSVDWAYWTTCEKRSTRLLGLLDAAKKAPTFKAMENILYDHNGEPEQVHMDGTKCDPRQDEPEWSIRSVVWVINEKSAQVSFAAPPVSSRETPREWIKFEEPAWIF